MVSYELKMVRGSAERKRKKDEENECKKTGKPQRSNSSQEMSLSRKLRKKVEQSQEEQYLNGVKRKKRQTDTENDSTSSAVKADVDHNQNINVFNEKTPLNDDSGADIDRVSYNNVVECRLSQNLDSFQRDLIVNGLGHRQKVPQIRGFKTCAERSMNLVHCFQEMTLGNRCRLKLQKV